MEQFVDAICLDKSIEQKNVVAKEFVQIAVALSAHKDCDRS
jgi:hypothetical protein